MKKRQAGGARAGRKDELMRRGEARYDTHGGAKDEMDERNELESGKQASKTMAAHDAKERAASGTHHAASDTIATGHGDGLKRFNR